MFQQVKTFFQIFHKLCGLIFLKESIAVQHLEYLFFESNHAVENYWKIEVFKKKLIQLPVHEIKNSKISLEFFFQAKPMCPLKKKRQVNVFIATQRTISNYPEKSYPSQNSHLELMRHEVMSFFFIMSLILLNFYNPSQN